MVDTSFLASHQLAFKNCEQEDEHSHSWAVTVAVCSEKLNEDGFVMDFCILKEKVRKIVAELQGNKLEDMECFKDINASAENVAKYIFDKLKPQLSSCVQLDYVEVVEAAGCAAKYSN